MLGAWLASRLVMSTPHQTGRAVNKLVGMSLVLGSPFALVPDRLSELKRRKGNQRRGMHLLLSGPTFPSPTVPPSITKAQNTGQKVDRRRNQITWTEARSYCQGWSVGVDLYDRPSNPFAAGISLLLSTSCPACEGVRTQAKACGYEHDATFLRSEACDHSSPNSSSLSPSPTPPSVSLR